MVDNVVAENVRSEDDRDEGAEALSPDEMRFVDALARGASMDEAATEIGKSTRTLRRWKRRPEVAAAIQARMTEALAVSRAILASAANRAARELEKLCTTAEPDTARIAACKAVIEHAYDLGKLQQVVERMAEIEARLPAKGN